MAIDVEHDARSYHTTQLFEDVDNFPQSVAVFDEDCKLEDVPTEVHRNWVDLERDFNKVEGGFQILREVVERQLKVKLKAFAI